MPTKTAVPRPKCCVDIDALVFDIQDIGARFYTYVSTMAYAMEEAAKAKIPYYVLDRPNPITGVHVEPPVLDREQAFFRRLFSPAAAARHDHGRTGHAYSTPKTTSARDLTVVRMKGWERGDWFDATGLALGQSFAKYAQPDRRPALSGCRDARVFAELFGGTRN